MGIGVSMAYNINFHQTFKPERSHISELLTIKNLTATKEEISHQFGIPTGKSSGKVEVNLLYAQAAELLNFTKSKDLITIERTYLGDKIYENDSYLEHELTKLLIHYMFCTKDSKLLLWELLFTNYHKGKNTVDATEFKKFAEKKINVQNIKLAPLLGSYFSEDPIIDIGILNKSKINNVYNFGKTEIIQFYSSWYAFFVYHFLFRFDHTRMDFTLEEFQFSGFPHIFGWDNADLRTVLELIEVSGYLTLNKQFSNYHIYLNKNIIELIDSLEYL